MQTRLLSLLVIVSIFFSCAKNDDSQLVLSQSSFELDNYQTTVSVVITTSGDWSVINEYDWCELNKIAGTGTDTLEITVDENDTGSNRTASIFVKSGIDYEKITIAQYSEYDDEQFEIPVIFHVLYKNALDNNQYVKSAWLAEVLEEVNEFYSSPTNINLTFTLATEDEDGNTLTEAGVNRIKVDDVEIDIDDFMSTKTSIGVENLWSLTSYINVFIYTFEQDSPNSVVMGVSHLPYTVSDYALDGLVIGDYYLDKSYTTDYPHCVSINNEYIYSRSDDNTYVATDIVVTLSHELGHYVGLLHAFEDGDDDTDYCDDTPNYVRSTYESWLSGLSWINPTFTLYDLCQRTATDGSTFTARNIMDYYYCYSDEYTEDQRTRIRHVLNYSPLMPGPKRNSKTKSSSDDVKPQPRYVK